MFGLGFVGVGLIAFLSVLAVIALARRPESVGVGAQPWLRRMRVRVGAALAVAAAVGVGLVVIGSAHPGLFGLPLALAPGLAAAAGLLVLALVPEPQLPAGPTRAASLTPRRPWSYGRRRQFAVVGALAVTTIAVLVATGLSSSPDEFGLYRQVSLTVGDFGGSSGPYPGWWYGVPLMIVVALLAGAVCLALRQAARWSAPAQSDLHDLQTADETLRRSYTGIVTDLASAALLGHLAGVLGYAGRGLRSLAEGFAINGFPTPVAPLVFGWVALVAAAICLVIGVVLAGRAAASGVRAPLRTAAAVEQAQVRA